jgi:hypothetical protein
MILPGDRELVIGELDEWRLIGFGHKFGRGGLGDCETWGENFSLLSSIAKANLT